MSEEYVLSLVIKDKELYKELVKKGCVELVQRRKDAHFKAMPKCDLVKNIDQSAKDVLNAALQKKMKLVSKSQMAKSLRDIGKGLNYANGQLKDISSELRGITSAVDSLMSNTEVIKSLSFLNTGLSAVNLGVNIAGFIIISQKLDKMEASIKSDLSRIEAGIDDLKQEEVDKLCEAARELKLKFSYISGKLAHNEDVKLDDLEGFLMQANKFCSERLLKHINGKEETGFFLDILFAILPAYSALLEHYEYAHFSEKGRLPDTYQNYLSLFNEILEPQVVKAISDHLFLNEKISSRATTEAVYALEGTVLNYATEVMDRGDLIRMINDKEKYDALEVAVEKEASNELISLADEIAKELGISSEYTHQVLEQTCATNRFYA